MARADIQIFACPACSKLYKRWVETWIDFQTPRLPRSPSVAIPRTCVCGHTFLLSQSIVVANLSPTDRPKSRIPQSARRINEWEIDTIDIPAFLRKRDDSAADQTRTAPPSSPFKSEQGLESLRQLWFKFLAFFKLKNKSSTKSDIVKKVLWGMEATALPEQVVPDGLPTNKVTR